MCSGLGASGGRLPKDLPPRSTVREYLDLWNWDGTLGRIHHALYVEVREQVGREASPTMAIIDSQSAKGAPAPIGEARLLHPRCANWVCGDVAEVARHALRRNYLILV